MGETTGIEWTDSTYNPWVGCHKVSPGCKHCYAERQTEVWGKKFSNIRRTSDKTFFAPLHWGQLTERSWAGFPHRRIFTCSFSDFFLVEADKWRSEVWDIIRKTPQHIYQILTKRPERIRECLPDTCFECGSELVQELSGGYHIGASVHAHKFRGWPWPNVWLGTSVENQEWAEKRIPILTGIPAAIHFLSCEPLLERLVFDVLEGTFHPGHSWPDLNRHDLLGHIEWVIVGGESGPKRREMKPEWALSIRDQCLERKVPFYFKQWGGRYAKEGGRDLEGREWNEFPQIAGMIQSQLG